MGEREKEGNIDLSPPPQSTEKFPSREALLHELDQYGGVFDCQRSRDVFMYTLSAFSFALPQAMEVLSDCVWRPRITQEEVIFYSCYMVM